ncbi:MAG: VWA domain-containing protein [Chloroflexi bacterium]|nr:VWA domain-containing protein [Chloroflexota bacterium]
MRKRLALVVHPASQWHSAGRLHQLALAAVLLLTLAGCSGIEPPWPDSDTTLRSIDVAYSPEKAKLFEELVADYNRQTGVKVKATKMEWPDMLEAAAKGEFVAVSPDSSIWLDALDKAWLAAHPNSSSAIGTTTRFATTPAVIATWAGREGELGSVEERGWGSLLRRVKADSSYRWSHGSPKASASGLLALTAEFYAAAGKTYGLTKPDADREDVRKYVAEVERTIARYGGESDAALVDYLLGDGQKVLSAVVMPEASVLDYNRRAKGSQLVAVYPVEGSLMLDHPLVLLESPQLTPEQRRAYLDFARYLRGSEAQKLVVANGYRPVDVGLDLAKAGSPLKPENGVSVSQPNLLQIPAAGVLDYVKQAWATGLKRRANIILVVDVSGSMGDNNKIARAKEALNSFLRQIPSDQERVGLSTFSDNYQEVVPLDALAKNRQMLEYSVSRLSPNGATALYYAIWSAHRTLAAKPDPERINVVVAMTDGLENKSQDLEGKRGAPTLTTRNRNDPSALLRALQANGQGVLVFTIGYGADADMAGLGKIATSFDGQAYRAETDTIKKLYELISQNF